MKKFVVFMFLAVGMLMTSLPVVAQNDVKLTMEFKNEPLSSALLRLEQSSFYKFLFSYSDEQPWLIISRTIRFTHTILLTPQMQTRSLPSKDCHQARRSLTSATAISVAAIASTISLWEPRQATLTKCICTA